jgi:cytochrome P450
MTATFPGVRFVPRTAGTWRDPFTMYRQLREEDPVHHVEDGDYWVLSRYDDVFSAVRDPAVFSSAQGLTFEYDERHKAGLDLVAPMVFLDPPDHLAFRRLVAYGFTPRQVEEIEPAVRSFVTQRVERVFDLGTSDIVEELLKPLPSFVVAHYLGVPESDRSKFDHWTEGIVAANALGDPLSAAEAVRDLFDYFSDLIEYRRRHGGDDAISELVAASDGAGVSALQILGFAFTMITGGNDTTTGLLSVGLELLSKNPDQRDFLVAHPEHIPDAVDELLRLSSPVQGLARTTTRDIAIRGRTIPCGRKVLLLFASANRDTAQFGADAEELQVRRRPKQIVAFGYGPHHCLGAAAARLMARIVLEELFARTPNCAVDAAGGRFAPGHFVRWYESLPFYADVR